MCECRRIRYLRHTRYTAPTDRLTGRINWVQIDLGGDDHFIGREERLRVAKARQ